MGPSYTLMVLFAFYQPPDAISIEKFSNFRKFKLFSPLTLETPPKAILAQK